MILPDASFSPIAVFDLEISWWKNLSAYVAFIDLLTPLNLLIAQELKISFIFVLQSHLCSQVEMEAF